MLVKFFTDLLVWQRSHELVLMIYQLVQKFPIYEKFCLANQMRRSAVSISCNIAEGFHRRYKKDSFRFYNFAESSLEELKSQLLISRDLKYIIINEFESAFAKTREVGYLLHCWMKKIKR